MKEHVTPLIFAPLVAIFSYAAVIWAAAPPSPPAGGVRSVTVDTNGVLLAPQALTIPASEAQSGGIGYGGHTNSALGFRHDGSATNAAYWLKAFNWWGLDSFGIMGSNGSPIFAVSAQSNLWFQGKWWSTNSGGQPFTTEPATDTTNARLKIVRQGDLGYLNVSLDPYRADPTGNADSLAAITSALQTGQRLFFPAGIYRISGPLLIATSIRGEPPVTLSFSSSGISNAVTFTGNYLSVSDVQVAGGTNAGVAVCISNCTRSTFRNLRVLSAVNTGIEVWGTSVLNVLDSPVVSTIGDLPNLPRNGIVLHTNVTSQTIINPVVEGLGGDGIVLDSALFCLISGGTSESCGRGLVLSNACAYCRIDTLDLEQNTSADLFLDYQTFNNCLFNVLSGLSAMIHGNRNSIIGGTWNEVVLAGENLSASYCSVGANYGILRNNGTNSLVFGVWRIPSSDFFPATFFGGDLTLNGGLRIDRALANSGTNETAFDYYNGQSRWLAIGADTNAAVNISSFNGAGGDARSVVNLDVAGAVTVGWGGPITALGNTTVNGNETVLGNLSIGSGLSVASAGGRSGTVQLSAGDALVWCSSTTTNTRVFTSYRATATGPTAHMSFLYPYGMTPGLNFHVRSGDTNDTNLVDYLLIEVP